MGEGLTWLAEQFVAGFNITVETLNGWIASVGKTTVPVTQTPVQQTPVQQRVEPETVTTVREPEPKSEPKPEPEPKVEPQLKSEPEPKVEPPLKSEPEPKVEPQLKSEPEPKSEPPVDPQAVNKKQFEEALELIKARRDLARSTEPPTEWGKKAKQTFVGADAAVQKQVTEGAFDLALAALPAVTEALDGLDIALRKELENDLGLLDGWTEAQGEAATLRGKLDKLGKPPASLLGDPGYAGLASEIKGAAKGWTAVRQHNSEMAKLKVELTAIAKIPGGSDPSSALKAEWDAYKLAKSKAPDPATTIAEHDKLEGLRDAFALAGRTLCREYESGKAGPAGTDYYEDACKTLIKTTVVLFRQALKVPPKTPEIVALQQVVASMSTKTGSSYKEVYEYRLAAAEAARKVIPMRTQPANPAAAAFQAKWASAQKPIQSVIDGIDPTMPPQDVQAIKVDYEKIVNELAKKDACDYAECERLLAVLTPKIEPVLGALTSALAIKLDDMKKMPQGNTIQKGARAETARTAIANTHPVLLARLDAKQQCDLMDGLRTVDIPAFDGSNKNDPKRVAMKKLYASMSLDKGFMAKDDQSRTAMVEALKARKQELKDAKANWSVMSNEQKLALMKMLADQQCASFDFKLPKDGFAPFDDPASTNNGSYSPGDLDADPPQDKISVNTAQPVFHDFEAALDLVFHENGHKYQSTLVRALRKPTGDPPYLTEANSDPPYTQGRMFDLGNHGGTYVKGAEDYEIYKKQPEEDHAWTIGPRSAQMVLDMLSQPD